MKRRDFLKWVGLAAAGPLAGTAAGAEGGSAKRPNVLFITADGERIDRKVLSAKGDGELKVAFAVPKDPNPGRVIFAAFIGKDFPSCLQHIVSGPVPVK